MTELIHRHGVQVADERGVTYEAFVFGARRADGTWEGWLEFRPSGAGKATLQTDRETSQPDRRALLYWATGLEPVYLEGALARAR